MEPHNDATGAADHDEASGLIARIAAVGDGSREPVSAELDALQALGDLAGKKVGVYRVAVRVGGGVMAAVYRATDETTGQPVALKVLLPGADSVARERFRREAQLAGVLQHPNIVRTLHVGQISPGGAVYIAMELVDGPSLAEVLERTGRLSPQVACQLLAPIARALAYAHERDVVHRDVKPGNILLRSAEPGAADGVNVEALGRPVTPLLTDFGIARALDAPELTSVGRTLGTPAFMAPEQCAGDAEIDGRADVYALGAVLYRCLVGRPPFGGTTTQILHAHVYDPVLIPEADAVRLPPAVLHTVARAMVKEPGRRTASAGLLADELEGFTQHSGQTSDGEDATTDATRTMASLPATPSPVQTTRVLVPATPARGLPAVTRTGVVGAQRATTRPVVGQQRPVSKPPVRRRRPQINQAGVIILGSALGLLLVLLVASFAMNLLPDGSGDGTATTPASEAAVASVTTGPVLSPPVVVEAAAEAEGAQIPLPPTPMPERAATPSPQPTPAVNLASAWDDAQAFYLERDWLSALDWLIVVSRIDKDFERERVEHMLATVYMGLTADAIVRQQWENALLYLDGAFAVRPNAEDLVAMEAALQTMATASGDERQVARRNLQAALVVQAEWLASNDEPCVAADQMNAAILIYSSLDVRDFLERQSELRSICRTVEQAEALAEMGGAIVYSAYENGSYGIFSLPVSSGSTPVQLRDQASQPRISPDGSMLAYYSRQPGQIGLYGVTLAAAGREGVRLSDHSEDAADAPPSWNPQGDRLAYTSSNAGDGRYRVYLTWADGSRVASDLGYGKDPSWHPQQDLLVFNGIGDQGDRPGLWLMRSNGEGRQQLTDNGNDQRPIWTPDGQMVIFMSNGRDGNWELYKVNVATGVIARMTYDPAQDGLPAVSPDGTTVAFMSDRGGAWRIWYVPVAGGEARPLSEFSFALPSWLEHGIQWVK